MTNPRDTGAGPARQERSHPPAVCVLGLGLIGGSVLRAAVAAGRTAWGYNRSPGPVRAAAAEGFDATADLTAALRRAEAAGALIVIAVPLPAVGAVADAVAAHAPHCPVTDVVSVKAPVAAVLAERGLAHRYVGGHPMAGTAESGWDAGGAELFDGAVWVVAADDGADPAVWSAVAGLAGDCRALVVPAESAEHDIAVARVSHLPHVLAEALACAGAASPLALALGAGSFRDGTRVAGTDPLLVRAMCEGNAQALVEVLDETLARLTDARATLAAGNGIAPLVEQGNSARARFEAVDRGTVAVTPGAPGWIAAMREAGRSGKVWRGPAG